MSFFKDFSGSLLDSAKTGGTTGTLDVGNLANTALDAAASAIPFGSVVKDILDKLGLQENLNLVTKYGISSWGASTSPEQTKAAFTETVYPFVEGKLQTINVNNVAEVLNNIEDMLLANHYYYVALRDNHSKAKSTRLANDWAQKEMKDLRDNFVSAVTTEFAKYNVTFARVKSNETATQLANRGAIYHLKNGQSFLGGPSRDLNNYLAKQYYDWQVDFSKVKNLSEDENGNLTPDKKSSGGMVSMLALAGFAIFKFMK